MNEEEKNLENKQEIWKISQRIYDLKVEREKLRGRASAIVEQIKFYRREMCEAGYEFEPYDYNCPMERIKHLNALYRETKSVGVKKIEEIYRLNEKIGKILLEGGSEK